MCEVSVVILSYNFEKYIKKAIDSVLMQAVDFDYEIIIGDDFSTDNTRDVLIECQSRHSDLIRLILKDENIGSTRLMYDILTTECRGRYVINFDGDDYWTDPEKLAKQKIFLDNHPEFVGVGHIMEIKDLHGNITGYIPPIKKKGYVVSMDRFLKGSTIPYTSVLYRNLYRNGDPNEFSIMYKASRNVGDFTRGMILLNTGDIYLSNEIMSVYLYRKKAGETNFNSTFDWFAKSKNHINLLKANYEYFNGKYNFSFLSWETILQSLILSIHYRQMNRLPELYRSVPKNLRNHRSCLIPVSIKTFRFLISRAFRTIRLSLRPL